jgi:hypothetical protein|tara:strand:+ start:5037 stop:7853 length:2817 start_codon:yes stop_codon:yes gene_type:complete
MPTYEVTDPTSGRVLSLTGDKPPTEEDLTNIFKMYEAAPERARLEEELTEAQKEQAQAAYNLEAAEDTVLENLAEGIQEMSSAGVGLAVDTVDFLASPARVGYEFFTGDDVRSLREMMSGTAVDLDRPFMEERTAALYGPRLLATIATAGGGGAVQIARDPTKFTSALKDLAGLGMTKTAEQIGTKALVEAAQESAITKGISDDIKKMTDANRPQIEARSLTPDGSGGKVKRVDGGFEYAGIKATGDAKKGYDIPGIGKVDKKADIKAAIDDQFTSFMKAREQMQTEYNLRRQFQKSGDFSELRRMTDAPKRITFELGRQAAKKDVGFFTETLDTAEDALYYKVSPQLSGLVKVAAESSGGKMNRAYDEVLLPAVPVIQMWRTNKEAAKAMLDYARGIKGNNRAQFLKRLSDAGVNRDQLKAVNNYLNFRGQLFKEQRLNIGEEVSVQTERLHVQVQPISKSLRTYADKGRKNYLEVQQDQSRKALSNRRVADDEMIEQYQNPFLTDFRLLSQNDFLNEIAKRTDVGTLGVKNPTGQEAFSSIAKRLAEDLPEEVAARGARIIEDMVIGSQQHAPAVAQLISTLSYGGTLLSLKSAVLNLHDVFVSPLLNGVASTIRGAARTFNMRQKSFVDPKLSGINRQTQGEFAGKLVDELNRMADDPSRLDKANRALASGLEKGFKVTLFSSMDRLGKRAVMNSVIENGYDLAKKGEFNSKWANYFSEADRFTIINAFRKHGKNIEAMSEKEVRLMTDLAYAGLGQQQLISVAGRPLRWAKSPYLRPLYTLMGFAIVQRSILRKKVFDNLMDGNVGQASQNAALYIASAGVGYSVIDEARDFVFSGGEDKITGEELLFKAVVDQPLSVLTLNKAPVDQYRFNQFKANPYEFAVLSIAPAGGLIEQGGKAGIDLITLEPEKAFKHIMQIPALKNSIGTAAAVLED